MTDSSSVNEDEREDGSEIIERKLSVMSAEIIERKLSVMSDFINYDVEKVDHLEYTMGKSGEEVIQEENGEEIIEIESGEDVTEEKSCEDIAGEESGEDVAREKSGEYVAGEESGEEISSNIILSYEEDSGSKETYEEMQILISPKKKLKSKKKARSSSEKKAEGQQPKTKVESFPKKKIEKAPRKKEAESPARKKKADSPARKKKAESPARKKKAESPARKKKDESPVRKKKAESPARKKKDESPARKKKDESPARKKQAERPAHKKKAESPPPIKKTDSSPPKTKAAITSPIKKDKSLPKRRPLSPSPKKKKTPALAKTAVLSTTPKKEILKLKQDKKKKGGVRKKKGTKKKAAGVSKQDKEKKYIAEEHEVDYVLQDQPTEEGVEQLLEAIRKEAEHDPAAVARERERREDQLQEIKSILEGFDVVVQREKLKDWENEQWEGYLRGCGKANPVITCEANGYITTWQDLTEDEDAMSILRESHSCLELVKELELAIEESPDKTHEKKAAWMMTYKNLHELLQDKLDKATYKLLKCAANYLDPDTYNMRLVTSDVRAIHEIGAERIDEAEVLLLENNASILLCLWANLVRNPRFKGPAFSQIGHSIELPRSILLTECALRILHTSFDPYSKYQLNEKQKSLDQTNEKLKESDEENSEICTDTTAASIAVTPTSVQAESIAPTIRSTTKTKQKKKQAKALKSPRPSISKPIPMEVEEDKRDDDEISVPSTTISSFKQFLPHQIVDMKGNYVVGGVYHIDLVAIPPLPVIAANWILEQVEENPKLQHIKYHVDVIPPRPPKPGEKPTQAAMFAEAENRRYEDELTNAISVILKLPDFVLFLDQPQLAFWNEDHSLWVNEGFHELKYNEDNKSLSFKIVHFGVIGIMQSKYINFPYQSWELKPKEFCNNCCLSITGAQVSLVIEILGGQCCISQLQTLEDSALHAELCNEWMKARQLLKKLKNIGVYIVPDEYATSYLGNTPKETELDDSVYKTIAMFADIYLFGSSHWNTTVGPNRIVMKYSPTCGRDEERIKNLLLVEHEKAIFLQCVEQSSSFREEPLAGSECCAVFYHLLLSGMPPNGFQRMNQTREEYCTCIYKLLSSIKLLSY